MASYSSYRKIVASDSILPQTITDTAMAIGTRKQYGVRWFFGEPCACSQGCCCLWAVPANVRNLQIEAWGSGGSGHGACTCDGCHHYKGAGGGYYNNVTITTTPGAQYTICAAGNGPCCRFECTGCIGCSSYVNGPNLSNFCAIGGTGGCANTDWSTACNSEFSCCIGPTANGSDFTMGNHPGTFDNSGLGICKCWCNGTTSTGAPFIGGQVTTQLTCCVMRCGCWTVPYGTGGHGAMTTFCGGDAGAWCGQGGLGGPGLVKITYY
jgi:hypothetical protein